MLAPKDTSLFCSNLLVNLDYALAPHLLFCTTLLLFLTFTLTFTLVINCYFAFHSHFQCEHCFLCSERADTNGASRPETFQDWNPQVELYFISSPPSLKPPSSYFSKIETVQLHLPTLHPLLAFHIWNIFHLQKITFKSLHSTSLHLTFSLQQSRV